MLCLNLNIVGLEIFRKLVIVFFFGGVFLVGRMGLDGLDFGLWFFFSKF